MLEYEGDLWLGIHTKMQAPRSPFSGLPEYFKPLKLGWILSLLSSSDYSDFENSGAQKSSPRKYIIIIHSSIIPWTLRIHRYVFDITSGQIIIFHQAGFSWNKGISLHQLYPLIVFFCHTSISNY